MPYCLNLNGNSSVSVPVTAWSNPNQQFSAFDAYINTAASGPQIILAACVTYTPFQKVPSLQGAWQFQLWLAGDTVTLQFTSLFAGQTQQSGTVQAQVTSSLADGNWHQIGFTADGQYNFAIYIDGVQCANANDGTALRGTAKREYPRGVQAPRGGNTASAQIVLGANGTDMPSTPAFGFSGLMSEIRFWVGGNPLFFITPAYNPNYGAPVPANAPNLTAYWPFWGSLGTQQVADIVAQQVLSLSNCSLAYTPTDFYDDLSEVIYNSQPNVFPVFVGGQANAFTWLMQQLGFAPPLDQTAFRAKYAEDDTPFSSYQTTIKTPPADYSGLNFTPADYQAVSSQLFNELTAVISVWSYHQSASNYLAGTVIPAMTLAASSVQSADMFVNYSPPTSDTAADIGDAIECAGALLSAALPEGGEIAASALQGLWSLCSSEVFPSGPPAYNPYVNVSIELNSVKESFATAITALNNNLLDACSGTTQNWGALSSILTRQQQNQSFQFSYQFNSQALDALGNGTTLALIKAMITAAYQINVFYADATDYTISDTDTNMFNWSGNPNFPTGPTDPNANDTVIAWFDGQKTFTTPPATIPALINSCLPTGQSLSNQEVFSWNMKVFTAPATK